MIFKSSSLARPVRTSASTPRVRKMATAAGESWSAMRTLGVMGGLQTLPLEGRWPRERPGGGFSTRWRWWRQTPTPDPSPQGGGALGRREFGSEGGEGPVEPGRQRAQVVGVDRGAAPDAQARRRIAVAADVERDALLLQQRGEALGEVRLGVVGQGGDLRRDHLQADRGVGAARRILGQETDPGGLGHPLLQRL